MREKKLIRINPYRELYPIPTYFSSNIDDKGRITIPKDLKKKFNFINRQTIYMYATKEGILITDKEDYF